ncbi:hypothetical protein DAKH74_016950 [Maudiozyma humilis]|uniref:UspA domain-containing protein n=1 Tax=Maudiozyma humilis TaxID=51915 RepID=A0AAV5RTX1_MAUHU|nr:hypothetical protein DAKH74_016950 [Kazachstania humilis]
MTTEETTVRPSYERHISFDNLSPSLVDDEIQLLKSNNRYIGYNNRFSHIPPQYNPLYGVSGHGTSDEPSENNSNLSSRHGSRPQIHPADSGFRSLSSQPTTDSMSTFSEFPGKGPSFPIYKTTSAGSRSESPLERRIAPSAHVATTMKLGRLPPPPEQSILKKVPKAIDEQQDIENVDISDLTTDEAQRMTKLTNDNTQWNSGSKAHYTQSLFSNLNEVEDRVSNKSRRGSSLSLGETGSGRDGRRKSFANMTNEELAALENSYVALGRSTKSTIDQFDFGTQNPLFFDESKKAASTIKLPSTIVDSLACVYPSRPSVDHKALSLTVTHPGFQECVNDMHQKLNNKYKDENGSLRVVSCYISGRRFTWSTVDWYIENFARDGDHLVIITCIPEFKEKFDIKMQHEKAQKKKEEMLQAAGRGRSTERVDHSKKAPKTETPLSKAVLMEGVYDEANAVCRSIVDYYYNRLKDKKVKLTLEMVKEDSTKLALTKVAALYKPSVHIVATVSANIQIKFRNGNVKLPFFVMKHYTIPVIVVPFEFIDRNLLIEGAPHEKSTVTKDNRLRVIDSIFRRTLVNPFLQGGEHHTTDGQEHDMTSSDDEESVASVNGYFPISTEQQKKINQFEQLGYVFPKSTREKLFESNDVVYDQDGKRLTPVQSKNSRRSSRVQFQESGLYKVKSMIDGVLTPEEVQATASNTNYNNNHPSSGLHPTFTMTQPLRKTKSSAVSASGGKKHHHRHHSGSSKGTTSSGERFHGNSLSTSTSRGSRGSSSKDKTKAEKKKKSGGFGSMFKKVFG